MSGYSRDELIGSHHSIVRHPDMPKAIFKDLWQHIKANKPWVGLIKNRCKNGDFYWVYANITPMYQEEELIGYLSVRYKATSEQIQAAESSYRLLSLPCRNRFAGFRFSLKTIYHPIVNMLIWMGCLGLSIGAAWLHYSPLLLGAFLPFLLLEYRRNSLNSASIHTAVQSLNGMVQGDFQYPIPIDSSDDTGRILQSIKSAQIRMGFDMAELTRVTDELNAEMEARIHTEARMQIKEDREQSLQHKTRLLANISHEIRTPMNSIVSVAELLMDTPLNPQQMNYIDIVHGASQHILSLINDMLELSKIEAGNWNMERVPFRLSETLGGIARGLLPLAQDKGLSLELKLSEQIPDILLGCPVRLTQVITNLVGNAIKFTLHGGVVISVEPVAVDQNVCEHGPVTLRFAVKDTGMGISPDNQERVFKAFEQAHGQDIEGTGLGLAISSSLIQLMAGQLKLESIQGQGSTFYFDLNMQHCTDMECDLTPESHQYISLAGKRVLLVEDNTVNLKLAKARMEKLGCAVSTAENGQAALDILVEERFDLILMDMRMPVMDGLVATQLHRQREVEYGLPRTPIVALTANAHEEDIEVCMAAGMDSHVGKPFTVDMLLRGIAAAYAVSGSFFADNKDYDPQTALQFMDGDKALLQELIELFILDYPKLMGQMRKALTNATPELGQAVAHSLKGSSGSLSAHAVHTQAAYLETLFKEHRLSEAEQAFIELENMGARLLARLGEH
ncbi:MAG: response regulator [Methylococcaceae bacterium]